MSKSSRSSTSARSNFSESYYGRFAPYVPVAQRRAKVAKLATKAAKGGYTWSPVVIEGRKIAKTFWGEAWCKNLESYSDFENRLPRGRTYARNGSVVDLKIEKGVIIAQVQGSSLYTEKISISPLPPAKWAAIKAACAGKVTSLVGLLQGKLPEEVLRVITNRATGLFPAPDELKMNCSCPDWASLCKHLAAVLYGVGARLDERPELLFLLRGVDHQELVAEALDAASRGAVGAGASDTGETLTDGDLADVFGIDIGGPVEPIAKVPAPVAAAPVLPVVKALPGVGVRVLSKADLAKMKALNAKESQKKKLVQSKLSAPTSMREGPVTKRPRGSSRLATTKVKAALETSMPRVSSVSDDLADVMASLKKMQTKPTKKSKAAK